MGGNASAWIGPSTGFMAALELITKLLIGAFGMLKSGRSIRICERRCSYKFLQVH